MSDRYELHKESLKRIRSLKFGDPVTNVCAGDKNPHRHAWFSQLVTKSHRNRYGITHIEHWAKCTDRKGNFWNAGIEVTFPGHLSVEESDAIFTPIHKILFG